MWETVKTILYKQYSNIYMINLSFINIYANWYKYDIIFQIETKIIIQISQSITVDILATIFKRNDINIYVQMDATLRNSMQESFYNSRLLQFFINSLKVI